MSINWINGQWYCYSKHRYTIKPCGACHQCIKKDRAVILLALQQAEQMLWDGKSNSEIHEVVRAALYNRKWT